MKNPSTPLITYRTLAVGSQHWAESACPLGKFRSGSLVLLVQTLVVLLYDWTVLLRVGVKSMYPPSNRNVLPEAAPPPVSSTATGSRVPEVQLIVGTLVPL